MAAFLRIESGNPFGFVGHAFFAFKSSGPSAREVILDIEVMADDAGAATAQSNLSTSAGSRSVGTGQLGGPLVCSPPPRGAVGYGFCALQIRNVVFVTAPDHGSRAAEQITDIVTFISLAETYVDVLEA